MRSCSAQQPPDRDPKLTYCPNQPETEVGDQPGQRGGLVHWPGRQPGRVLRTWGACGAWPGRAGLPQQQTSHEPPANQQVLESPRVRASAGKSTQMQADAFKPSEMAGNLLSPAAAASRKGTKQVPLLVLIEG